MKKLTIINLIAFIFTPLLMAQSTSLTEEQIAMQKLSFLMGNWSGKGTSYDQLGKASDYFDTENIWYDVKESILVIQANGYKDERHTYSLHTIVHYDEAAKHYWYQPFTAKGARKYRCDLNNKKLLCHNENDTFRLTFQRLENGQWNEFGERKDQNDKWFKSFETKLDPVSSAHL